ncbi:MAG: hypothetical protein DRR06_12215 [Gammaproteobacteria bacterium]|nr:MAG: hypothetical protein DRR06_12215 [Gammaproteobacteria bacterium]RLA49641.1 MAG: hypothetical protein DRR42_15385 [Gammaproteobacteria bacterium]
MSVDKFVRRFNPQFNNALLKSLLSNNKAFPSSVKSRVKNVASKQGGWRTAQKYVASLLLIVSLPILAESVQRPALKSALASRALLADSVRIGDGSRYLGVGIYGNIVYSDDSENWIQSNSPTQMLLTTVFFTDEKNGWAGGHDTLILHTKDGGENWEIQHEDPIPGGDIPKPVLDILFTDNKTGYAIGAYGLMLHTVNGGESWQTLDTLGLYDRLEALELEPEPNFNYFIPYGDKILIVGELGTILLFDPAATTDEERWGIIDSPYEGTFFGAKQVSSGDLYIYGLRGNIYRSSDNMQTWQKIQTDVIANVYGCIELAGGKLVFLASSGTILALNSGGTTTEKLPYTGFDTLVSGQIISGNKTLLFGTRGVQIFDVP